MTISDDRYRLKINGLAVMDRRQEWAETTEPSIAQVTARIRAALGEQRDVRRIWSRWLPELAYGRHLVPPPPDARRAAVLVLLYPGEQGWQIPLIQRVTDTTIHSGQVSFPGGSIEGDESPIEGALREYREELGALPHDLQVAGELTPTYIFASNYAVNPCLAVAPVRPDFASNPAEVASVLELPVKELVNPSKFGVQRIERRGVVFEAPYLEFQGHFIWGATSLMLAELAAVFFEHDK